MKTARFPIAAALVLAVPLFGSAAQAQTSSFTTQQVSDADRLSEQMRVLAATPTDLNALIAAGELTLDMGDTTAARNLFMRADRVSPRDPRVIAGTAKVMVELERPGEALRLFAQAESLGLASSYYATERGLAYDLVGQQQRAQRDYRAALKMRPDDETTRRLALSLGISGQREAAFALLDPLLRQSDRGAWRARAFILAMGGDTAGADKIAVNMMPPGMAQGLAPFFQRLPMLSAIDRAFAVHFGEVRPTAERIADARLVPPLAPLPPEPVQVVAVVAPAKPDKKAKKPKRGQPVQVAAAPPPPVVAPEPLPPRYLGGAGSAPAYPSQPVAIASVPAMRPAERPATLASSSPTPERRPPTVVFAAPRTVTSIPMESNVRVAAAEPSRVAAPVTAIPAPVTIVPTPVPVTVAPPAPVVAVPVPTPAAVAPIPSSAPVTVAAAPVTTPPAAMVQALPPQPAPVEVAERAPLPAAPKRFVGSEDKILASIVANIAVPASELGVEPMPGAAPPPVEVAAAEPAPEPVAKPVPEKKPPVIDKAAVAKKAAADKVIADKKAAADKKALADKKAAAEQLAADKKEAADKKAAAKADPARIWVQVAGGATEGDLAKAWKRVSAKAPALFKGRSGWTTPLRATNRVLTGPFKTDDEARAFVNKLAKEDISAFSFTSTVGQKIARLDAK